MVTVPYVQYSVTVADHDHTCIILDLLDKPFHYKVIGKIILYFQGALESRPWRSSYLTTCMYLIELNE